MRHALDYQVVISDEEIPVFILTFSENEASDAVMLYDGGNHATLYRNQDDVILLDYLPHELKKILSECGWAIILEKTPDGTEVLRDYKVMIKKVKNNPYIDNLP